MSDLRTLEELGNAARAAVIRACREVGSLENKEGALDCIADAVAALAVMSGRVQASDEFVRRRVRVESEEAREAREAAEEARTAVDAAPMTLIDVYDESIGEEHYALADEIRAASEDGAARLVHRALSGVQLRVLNAMIRYIWHGARNPWQMMKRALAITRRYQREELRGITMTEVAELLGECRCAGVSARERDVHDKYFQRWMVKAPKAADGGLRGPDTCAKNRLRALGNTNRRGKG